MSWSPCDAPEARDAGDATAIETIIIPRARDIGGFEMHRILPFSRRRMVGPFVFFDRMGPSTFAVGSGLDIRPHPHIGLATVTYLFAGGLVHRDSLGTVQTITPGAVNWMTAGRGIAHSERTEPEARRIGSQLSGIQAWVAVPQAAEEMEPAFSHHAADALPFLVGEGWCGRLIAGSFEGVKAPTPIFTPTLYADITMAADARLSVSDEHEERAVYVVEGDVRLAGHALDPGVLYVLASGQPVTLTSDGTARLMLIGGAVMDGPRYIWWNFVSSSRERIEQAKADWKEQRFPPVPGENEFIPLPDGF